MFLKNFKASAFYTAVLLLFLSLTGANGSPYVISDDRIRSLDISPVLGRGYSIMTNSFQSTCLMVDETNIPSYNYDYSFYDFTQTTNIEVDMSSKYSYSFGYWWFKAQVTSDYSSQSSTEKKKRYITASMRIERYYSSIREELSPLNEDAIILLNRNDYVGFFKACGPNYIRGIRRAQEVTAFFIFESTSTERATQYSRRVQVSSWWWNQRYGSSYDRDTKYNSESQSMRIVIKGYGIGLSQDGSETFVAQSLQDYSRVMKFAFKTMTVNPDAFHIGMVYGMEIVPWVENVQFQVQANILDEAIEIPIARSLIPRAFLISDPNVLDFDNTSDATRALYRCKEASFEKDKYGYCCESGSLYDTVNREYSEDSPSERVCRPLRMLEPAMIKDNLAANGEFVARMDRAVRYRLNQLSTLERCISAVRAIPDRYDYYILKSKDNVKFDGRIDINFSVFELKMALDPFNDYAMLKHMAKELDEFLEMFVQPCYGALFGSNIGTSPETDPSYFMAYPWHTHDECTKLSCLGNSMRWDRTSEEGGCVPSMIAGIDSPTFQADDENCKKDIETGVLKCKYDSGELAKHHEDTVKMWTSVLPRGRIDYFMDHFCMPTITGSSLGPEAVQTLKKAQMEGKGEVRSINVALNKPATHSSTYYHPAINPRASYAVDGNLDGNYGRKSTSVTRYDYAPWWQVDLKDPEAIKKIVVYTRTDCCAGRLDGFRYIIYHDGSEVLNKQFQGVIEYENSIDIKDVNDGETVVGDKVRIMIPGRREYLQLTEVQVWNSFLVKV